MGADSEAADLPVSFVDALQNLVRTRQLLVALDFDGTLAPEVDEPHKARALPAAHAAILRLLELPNTRVALISGRALDSLIEVANLPDSVLLFGSHGIELRLDHPDYDMALSPEEQARRSALGTVLGGVADSFEKVWMEEKPAGFALHTRLATEEDSHLAHLRALNETAATLDGLTVRAGKNVLEFSVRSTTKGEAIEQLRRYTGATAVFFAGDDVTDEDAFAALVADDVGLKSGDGQTLASFRVPGPEAVASAISLLAELRDRATPEP